MAKCRDATTTASFPMLITTHRQLLNPMFACTSLQTKSEVGMALQETLCISHVRLPERMPSIFVQSFHLSFHMLRWQSIEILVHIRDCQGLAPQLPPAFPFQAVRIHGQRFQTSGVSESNLESHTAGLALPSFRVKHCHAGAGWRPTFEINLGKARQKIRPNTLKHLQNFILQTAQRSILTWKTGSLFNLCPILIWKVWPGSSNQLCSPYTAFRARPKRTTWKVAPARTVRRRDEIQLAQFGDPGHLPGQPHPLQHGRCQAPSFVSTGSSTFSWQECGQRLHTFCNGHWSCETLQWQVALTNNMFSHFATSAWCRKWCDQCALTPLQELRLQATLQTPLSLTRLQGSLKSKMPCFHLPCGL